MILDSSTNTCPLRSNRERKPRVEAAPRIHRAMVLNPIAAFTSIELFGIAEKSEDVGVYSMRGGENQESRGRGVDTPLCGSHLLQLSCSAKLNCSGR